ncbi:MAG: invasin domain 3-containing protein [Oligoflexia bacterium]|nr:invasin domain 3-containing protein [Oligoflexia bacterium]
MTASSAAIRSFVFFLGTTLLATALSSCDGWWGQTQINNLYAPGIAQMQSLEILGPGVETVAACSGPYRIEVLDSSGNSTAVPEDIALSLTGAGSGAFYSDSSCVVPLSSSFTLATLASEYGFYYRADLVQTNLFIVTGGGLNAGSLDVTVVSSLADHLVLIAGNNESAAGGSAISPSPEVEVVDASGNPVPGFSLAWSPSSGSVSSATTATNGSGKAQAAWTLGHMTGAETLVVQSAGEALPGTPSSLTFNATATAGAPSSSHSTVTATSPVLANGTSAAIVTITLDDQYGNPVSGITPTISVSGSNVSVGACSSTNGSGVSTCSVTATTSGVDAVSLTSPLNLSGGSIVFEAGAATKLVWSTEPGGGTAGSAWATQGVVKIEDASGNVVTSGDDSTAPITLSVQSGTGSLSGTITVDAVAGIANFSSAGLFMTAAGTKVLQASKADLSGSGGSGALSVNSTNVTITPASPSSTTSSIAASPASLTADGSSQSTLTVTVEDQYGNPIPSQTVALSASGSGNTLAGPSSSTSASGITTATISTTVSGVKTVSIASPSSLSSLSTSVTFNAGAAVAANSTITGTGPVVANGTATSTVTITLVDAHSNPVVGVVPSFLATDTGSTNSYGACSATNSSGQSTCTLTSSHAEAKTLSITSPVSKTGGTVTFTNGPATQLVWTTQPSGGTAGVAWSPQGIVTIEDANGNVVTTGADAGAQISLSVSGGSGTISGTTSLSAVNGVANFAGSGLYMTVAGTPTIRATKAATSGSGVLTVDSSPITISPAAINVAQSSISANSGTANGDGVTTITVTITVKDQYGNAIPGQNASFSATGSGNILTQPASTTNSSGQASGTIASTAAQTKTLTVVTPAALTSLNISVQFIASSVVAANSSITGTGSVIANGTATSTITITLEDSNSNPVSGITPSFSATNTGNTNVYGTCSSSNSSGVSTCTLTSTVAEIKTLQITGPVTKSGGSVTFTNGPATQLVWTTQPSGGTAGVAWSPQGVLTIKDANGNVVTTGSDATSTVTLAVASGTGTLSGTTSMSAVNGVANFTGHGLYMTAAGNKTILATESVSSLTATSSTITITEGSPSASTSTLAASPTSATADGTSSIALTATVEDQYGNPISGQSVTLSAAGNSNTLTQPGISTNSSGQTAGSIVSTLAQTETVSITSPAALSGINTSITFTAGSPVAGNSTITGSGPVIANGTSTSTITITLEDANNNPVSGVTPTFSASGSGNSYGACSSTNSSGQSTCTLASTIAASQTLSITTPVTKSGGTVIFTNGAATQLAWTTSPSNGTAGSPFGTQGTVTIEDANGNVVTTGADATATVTLAIVSGSGALLGTTSMSAIAGVANFTGKGLQINTAGSHTLLATKVSTVGSGGVGALTATSSSFTINAASANVLALSGYPTSVTAGAANNVTITAQDAYGNTATSYTGTIAVTSSDTHAALPSNYTFQTSDSGVKQLSVTLKTAASQSITATDTITSSITGTESGITVNASSTIGSLAWSAAPATSYTASSSTPMTAFSAALLDPYGNPITNNNSTAVTLSLNTGTGTLVGTLTETAVNGVATFSTITYTKAETIVITATENTASHAVSSSNITVNPAAFSLATSQVSSPSTVASGSQITVTLTAKDAYGNANPSGITSVAFTSSTTTGTGTYTGGVTNAGSGVYTQSFQGVLAGSVTLGAAINSGMVTSTPSPATIAVTPSSTIASIAWVSAPVTGYIASNSTPMTTFSAELKDAAGNVISTNNSTTVTLSRTTGSGSLGGTLTEAVVNGVATFSDITYTAAETLVITATENTANHTVASSGIVVSPGAFSLADSAVSSASTVVSGSSITVTLTTKDAYGNSNPSGTTNVAFTSSTIGGTGSYGTVTNAGGGVYTASFTGAVAGSVTLGATINGGAVTSTPVPATITVTPSSTIASLAWKVAPATSYTASNATPMTTFSAELKDAAGNVISTNNSTTVTLSRTTGSGSLGGTLTETVVNGVATFSNITYTVAETLAITATENTLGYTVASPNVVVGPAAFSLSQSIVSSLATVNSGSSITVSLTAEDAYGNSNPTGITSVAFTSTNTAGTGSYIGSVTNAGNGVYSQSFQGSLAGSVTLGATINGSAVTSTPVPATITVYPPAPTAPTSLGATGQAGYIALSWTAPSGSFGALTYSIYRGTISGGESATPIATALSGTTYNDTTVTVSQIYFYEVVAVGTGGTSPVSNEASATASAPCASGSQVFAYTGAAQTFTVPTGCTAINIKAWGAGGGGGSGTSGTDYAGGGGGYATGTLSVTAGQSYTVIVGGGGALSGAGGYGGGGTSYGGGGYQGGSGGGRSAIQSSGTELLTAGGGGGGGDSNSVVRYGGAAGGTIGNAGAGSTTAGQGGTQSAGGGAGAGSYGNGNAGNQFTGGNGNGSYGAGGGGGYYGGGGSGYNSQDIAGGGGGSSYVGGSGLSNTATIAGSGAIAGNSSDSDNNGAGGGGAVSTTGANGRVVIYYGAQLFSVSPPSGASTGGTTLTLNGLGFVNGTTVTVGGNSCTSVNIVSSSQLTCTYPSGSVGAANVVVTIPGYSALTLTNGFTYFTEGSGKSVLTYTGNAQSWVAPAGISSVTIKVWGAGGAGGSGTATTNYAGGGGGYATATLSVTSGQSYTLIVGGGGSISGAGGYGGGGTSHQGAGYNAGGGGGRSAVQLNGTELLTAGGGGGGGTSTTSRIGGAGGGTTGSAGTGSATAGQGGTQSAGGAAGIGSGNGTAGTQFTGGDGNASFGAGGGGGYYGGGGSGWNGGDVAGGGGGSSYIGGAGLSSASTTAGSGATAGNSGDSDNSGAGAGGAVSSGGANGLIVIYY